MRVINFSGGGSSGMMTLMLNPTPDDIVLFTDTKREKDATYKYLNDFEAHEGIKIHRATYTHPDHPGLEGFEELIAHTGRVPGARERSCTRHLKIITAKKYLNTLGIKRWDNYIGFRGDEVNRVKDYHSYYKCASPYFPLHHAKISERHVSDFWLKKPYKLYLAKGWKNCDFCFLKGEALLIALMQEDPAGAEKWIFDEIKTGHTFLKGKSYSDLMAIAKTRTSLFDVDKIPAKFNCSCTS